MRQRDRQGVQNTSLHAQITIFHLLCQRCQGIGADRWGLPMAHRGQQAEAQGGWDVERLADPILRSRSYHVLTENQRVLDTIEAASQGHWDRVRTLFWESHASLSRDYAVSTPRLDATVACLQTLHIGARLTGAGFGGAVIALGPADQTEEMEDALGRLYRQEGWGTPAFLPVPMPVRGLERVG